MASRLPPVRGKVCYVVLAGHGRVRPTATVRSISPSMNTIQGRGVRVRAKIYVRRFSVFVWFLLHSVSAK